MNAVLRPWPDRDIWFNDIEVKIAGRVCYFSALVTVRHDSSGPYVEGYKDDSGNKLVLPAAITAAIEEELDENENLVPEEY